MATPRFFVSIACYAGLEIELEPDDAHHAAHVLRMAPGDRIVVVGQHAPWDAEITTLQKKRVHARITGPSADAGRELPIEITVLQALTKGAKFDDVVEKCVELGAVRIVPVRCERSYAEATPARIDRWRRIAKAAAQQSRRRVIPFVDECVSWNDAIALAEHPLLVAWEGAPAGSLGEALDGSANATAIAIGIGPEGSFTEGELTIAREHRCAIVSLGPTILRTETAAAALIAAIASRRW
jgi:16S rRNA (uracil1498-N3)-methyltransferase